VLAANPKIFAQMVQHLGPLRLKSAAKAEEKVAL